jgi:hypothetical protein
MYYRIFKHKITIENIQLESYGIEVYEDKVLVHKLFDISTDYDALARLVDSLNEDKIDIIHLDSILEDFYLDNV